MDNLFQCLFVSDLTGKKSTSGCFSKASEHRQTSLTCLPACRDVEQAARRQRRQDHHPRVHHHRVRGRLVHVLVVVVVVVVVVDVIVVVLIAVVRYETNEIVGSEHHRNESESIEAPAFAKIYFKLVQ